MAISEEDVARIRATTDIVALIGEHAALKRQGTRWVALCPFHEERTPSFSVNAELGVYYCFGCQRSGDAITFMREMEHLDFVGALRVLADRAGIVIKDDSSSRERKHRAPLYEALSKAVAFYHERLLSASDAGRARDYLRSRGYDGDVVRRFQLGWAPDEFDALSCALNVPDDVLSGAGLGFVNRLGRQQDNFRSRVIFPIFDPSGKAIALGGRVLPGQTEPSSPGPKYKNSPEGPIYSKKRTLYALNWAKKDVVASGEVIVCEGYTDVIGCFLAGLPRAVATCGTALGEPHFRLLCNFAKRIVLAYDADSAGQSGASRVYEWERNHQVDVAVATLPPGSDPGGLALKDPEALREAVAGARPFLSFRLETVFAEADLTSPEGRAKAAEAAISVVAEHPNELVRDQYLMNVADRTRVEPATLRSLLDRELATAADGEAHVRRRSSASIPGSAAQGPSSKPVKLASAQRRNGDSPTQRAGMEALRLAVHDPETVSGRLLPTMFPDDVQRAAFEMLDQSSNVNDAIAAAEEDNPQLATLLRRLAVEEPFADPDDVVVQVVRFAARRALSDLESQARLSPESFAELASEIARVKNAVEDLDEPDSVSQAADWLLAWLTARAEEIS